MTFKRIGINDIEKTLENIAIKEKVEVRNLFTL